MLLAIASFIGVYFLPARRTLVQVAALAGALLIALQMTITYWLYPYLVWFFPLVLLAIFASHAAGEPVGDSWDGAPATEGDPIPMRIGTAPS